MANYEAKPFLWRVTLVIFEEIHCSQQPHAASITHYAKQISRASRDATKAVARLL